jgi:hypothetical protein
MAITVYDILSAAAVSTRPYPAVPGAGIYRSDAGQLFGTYADLVRAQTLPQLGSASWPYRGWHRHHIVEFQDLERLGVAARFPAYDRQLCVLIPQSAHIERVNSVLNYSNPQGVQVTPKALRSAYESAYSMLGDYCGGGEMQIRVELLSIVDAVFTLAGFATTS